MGGKRRIRPTSPPHPSLPPPGGKGLKPLLGHLWVKISPRREGGRGVRSSSSTCPLCKEDRSSLWFNKDDYDFRLCESCSLAFIGPRPPEPSLTDLYDKDYYRGDGRYGYTAYLKDCTEIALEAKRRLDIIRRWGGKRGRVLDLGCAFGFFLDVAKREGWEVNGVEWSRHSASYAQERLGIEVHPTLMKTSFPDGRFDLVTMWEYIEHLHSPLDELMEINRILKQGGLLALSTPNMLSAFLEDDFTSWKQFKPPEHLSFFTPATIKRFLESVGFRVLGIESVGEAVHGFRSLGLARAAFGSNGLPFPLRDLRQFITGRLLGGGMIVVAKKNGLPHND